MARTEGQWKRTRFHISPNEAVPIVLENEYINFGGIISGDIGFGIRNNNGVIEIKNENGTWAAPGGGIDWGDIGGTLADQTDLQDALDAKVTGTTRITVATSAPASPATNDLWVDTN